MRTTRGLSARLAHVVHRDPNGAQRDLICTPGHPVWVESRGGYVAADEIQPGETLRDGSQQVLQVLRVWVEDLPRAIEVDNFEVDQDHTYFAASPGAVDPCPVLVHNANGRGCQRAGKTLGGADGSPQPAERLATTQKGGSPSSNTGWLQHWERLGLGNSRGHVIAEHVGKSDADLIARLAGSKKISAASTFTDQATAEAVIGGTIRHNRIDLVAWLRSAQPGDRLRLSHSGTDVIGRGIKKGQTLVGDRTNARIILQAIGNGDYHILTAFPE